MNSIIHSILIPTDFSPLSESALKVGIAIAKRQNAELFLLHVVDKFNYLPRQDVFLPDVKLTDDMVSTMEDLILEYSEKLHTDTGLQVTGKILCGIPSDKICQFAFQKDISLIVMGTHGVSGFREFFIGSEAFKVVKFSHCPVLTVPGGWEKTEFSKVLFPIRLIPGAIEKYFFIRPIIEKNNAELIILGLQEKEKTEEFPDLVLLIVELKIQLHNDNISFETLISSGEDFSSSVIETAEKREIDLIVITADLEYEFKSFFIGPFEQQVVNHSKVPVLSIKPSDGQNDPTLMLKLARNWRKSVNTVRGK
jgi:nucleotide-binding universal stress UspA family protein